MGAKHTPGPWSIGGTPFNEKVFGADGFEVAGVVGWRALQRAFCEGELSGEQWRTAPGATKDRTDDEILSNALLIAAAPLALKALLAVRAACRDPDTDTVLPSAAGELVEAALAAMGERS